MSAFSADCVASDSGVGNSGITFTIVDVESIDKEDYDPIQFLYMAVFGLNPFTKSKKSTGAKGKKTSGKTALNNMKKLKKKSKTCEFC